MKLETKYNVGYEFWVPRVFNKRYKESTIVDGKEYYRDYDILEIDARHKIVEYIEIRISDKPVEFKYYSVDFNNRDGWTTIYSESEMTFTDYDSAMAFARLWRLREGTEYFGSGDDED